MCDFTNIINRNATDRTFNVPIISLNQIVPITKPNRFGYQKQEGTLSVKLKVFHVKLIPANAVLRNLFTKLGYLMCLKDENGTDRYVLTSDLKREFRNITALDQKFEDFEKLFKQNCATNSYLADFFMQAANWRIIYAPPGAR